MYHYLIAVNYSSKENPPASTAVMSPYFCEEKLTAENVKEVYDILKLKVNNFLSEKEYRNKSLYHEIRIFRIEEIDKGTISQEVFVDSDDIDDDSELMGLKDVNYRYFELLMAFKDYDAFTAFEKKLNHLKP